MKKTSETELLALKPKDLIRLRVESYLGGDTPRNIALKEIYNNSQDAFIRNNIPNPRMLVKIEGNKFTVRDNAGGLPTGTQKDAEGKRKNAIFLVYQPFVGSNFTDATSNVSGNFGVGSSVVTATSSRFDVKVWKKGKQWTLSFRDGISGIWKNNKFIEQETPLIQDDPRTQEEKQYWGDGTEVSYILDENIYSKFVDIDLEAVKLDLKRSNSLIPNLTTIYENGNETHEYVSKGIQTLFPKPDKVHFITGKGIFERIRTFIEGNKNCKDKYEYNIGFSLTETGLAESFVSTTHTASGGSHVQAFTEAFTTVFEKQCTKRNGTIKTGEDTPTWADYAPFIDYVIELNMPNPPFTSFTKERINSPALKKLLTENFTTSLNKWVRKNPKLAQTIAEKGAKNCRERHLELLRKRKKRKTSQDISMGMPTKLVDSILHYGDPGGDHTTLQIVEGDSALGGLVRERDSKTQALFPIRGKILNVYDKTLVSSMNNDVISDIAQIIASGNVGKNFDLERDLRYGKIIFTCDADCDGYAIQSALLLAVHKLFPGLVESGRVYASRPPLFIVKETKTGKEHYCIDNRDLQKLRKKLGKTPTTIIRAKGLGEMSPLSIRNTLMNPDVRTLEQYEIVDEKKLEQELKLWFSNKEVESRKNEIYHNSEPYAKILL